MLPFVSGKGFCLLDRNRVDGIADAENVAACLRCSQLNAACVCGAGTQCLSEDVRKRVVRAVLDAGGDNVQSVGVYAVIRLCNLRLDGICVVGDFYGCVAFDASTLSMHLMFSTQSEVSKKSFVTLKRNAVAAERTGVSGSAACQPLLIIQPKST